MAGNLVPRSDNSTTLGTIDKRWKRLFTAEGLHIGISSLGTPSDGRLEYDGTHLYFTIDDERTQIDNQTGTGANTSANAIVVEFTYEDLGTTKYSSVHVPSGAFVHRAVVVVDTAFSGGSSPACAVTVHGPSVDTSLIASNRNDLTQVKQWNIFDIVKVPDGQGGAVKLALTGTASAGAGRVIVEYEAIPSTSGVFVRTGVMDTITAQHSFAPESSQAPFTLGTNAQGQLVTGFNADQLDGHDASYFQTADATLTALAGLSTSANKLILVTGTDTFSVGQLTDTYVDSLSQSKTHGSADTDTATTALHHTLGTGANQAAAGNHSHAISVPFTYSDVGGSKSSTATVPALAVVTRAVLEITSAFVGSGLSCSIDVHGSSVDTTLYTGSSNDMTAENQYMTIGLTSIPSSQGGPVRITLNGSASAGVGTVYVEYMLPAA